jgi:hypothetical protein
MAETGTGAYKGLASGSDGRYRLKLNDPSHRARPYQASFASAKKAAQLHDCFQLLLHGAAADTNSKWSSYTMQQVKSAAAVLVDEGWDLQASVKAAQKKRGMCVYFGVCRTPSKTFQAFCPWPRSNELIPKRSSTANYAAGTYATAAEAARAADMAALLVGGLATRRMSFPATTYNDQQLESSLRTMEEWAAARPHATKASTDALVASLHDNLESIQQARPMPLLQSVVHGLLRAWPGGTWRSMSTAGVPALHTGIYCKDGMSAMLLNRTEQQSAVRSVAAISLSGAAGHRQSPCVIRHNTHAPDAKHALQVPTVTCKRHVRQLADHVDGGQRQESWAVTGKH